jgi:hypothetical protein
MPRMASPASLSWVSRMLSKSIDHCAPVYLKRVCWGCVSVYGISIIFGILFWYEFIRFAVSML